MPLQGMILYITYNSYGKRGHYVTKSLKDMTLIDLDADD